MDLVAPQVAEYVRKWRTAAPEQWEARKREIDAVRLRAALTKAKTLGLDPYLLAYVVMGTEWLFRVRPLNPNDIERSLDQIESRLRSSVLSGAMPWQASLVVGGIYRTVSRGLKGTRYLISLGQWAFPIDGWRTLVAREERMRRKQTPGLAVEREKSGKTTVLSPIIAGLVVDALAEETSARGTGTRALALEVASILQGRKIQPGEFGVWLRGAEDQAPTSASGVAGSPDPQTLRQWLALRWRSAYEICFAGNMSNRRYWSTFLIEAATNPLALFAPLAAPEVVTQLYALPWYHDLSPRRKSAAKPRPKPRRPKRAVRKALRQG